jgi:hypothetical protein
MTMKELLKACGDGEMPKVKLISHRKYIAEGSIGQVVTIKNNRSFGGCSVDFGIINYDCWFHDSEDNDKRSSYMYQLEIVKS